MAVSEVVDVHVHIPLGGGDNRQGVDDVLRRMDRNGISAAVVSPAPDYETPYGVASTRAQNEALVAVLARWPDRFPVGLGVAEPRHGPPGVVEARRALGDGLGGLVFDNDVCGLAIDSDAMAPLLEEVAGRPGAVAACYLGAYSVLRSPFRLGVVARRLPQLRLLALHAFADITHETASVDLAERQANIWFCLSNAKTQLYTVERAVAQIGADRVLFGSGIPLVDRSLHLEMVRIADISDQDRQAILADNARRLFSIGAKP
jgi:predicted TIM-barrel fold metal-dependent hydrolase